ncbi:EAL domain-containing protein [Desulfocucumis palustris]|nr:EAL domain-containing protein [Desulfocucumis palustris]
MRIIDSGRLRILFQPIRDRRKNVVVGYEALVRGPEGSPLELPKKLFKAARKAGGRQELEMACFRKALSVYRSRLIGSGALLFVNFHPVVLSSCIDEILFELDGCRKKTVIEITEASKIRCGRDVFRQLKNGGVRVALDDVGIGDRSLSSICDLESDYLKVDKGVVRGIVSGNGSADKYGLVLSFLVKFGKQSGARVIVEGIETLEQLRLTDKTGVELVQGFYFDRPMPAEHWADSGNKLVVTKM